MAEYRFQITPGMIPAALLAQSYFAAWGRSPRPCQIDIAPGELRVQTANPGSGTIHVPWTHRRLGVVMESTETLLPRERPYLLLKELARGSLGRMLRKIFDWQLLGFRMPDELRARITQTARRFSKIAVCGDSSLDPALDQEFAELLREWGRIALESTLAFTEQSIAWRQRAGDKVPLVFGVGMNQHPYDSLYELDLYAKFLQEAFHVVLPTPTWRDLEPEPNAFRWDWLEQRLTDAARFGLQPVLGPLICFRSAALPTWLDASRNQEGAFEAYAIRFVNAITERYGALAQEWILASRLNAPYVPGQSAVDISTPRRIMLVQLLAKQMRSRGIETPILVGLDQLWGEYAVQQPPDMDQVQIAEALIGSREIDSFLLEVHFGFERNATFPRDPLAISSMIDQWSFLGKKVYVSFSIPSASGDSASNNTVSDSAVSAVEQVLEPEFQWSEGLQQYWAEVLLRMVLGKRMVSGVFWTPLQDPLAGTQAETSEPQKHSSGLIDSQRVLKLAFKQFSLLRGSFLK